MSGLPTNLGFLKRLCEHEAFQAAELNTAFIEKHGAALLSARELLPMVVGAAALALHQLRLRVSSSWHPAGASVIWANRKSSCKPICALSLLKISRYILIL